MVNRVSFEDCDEVYLGEMLRIHSMCQQEHQRHTQNAEVLRIAIAEHACGLGHRIDWDGAGIIEQEMGWRLRKMKKALYICLEKGKGVVMNKEDCWRVNEAWQAVI